MSTIKITKDNFETEVMQSDKPVLIDFWAGWCGPCKMLSPTVEEISNEMDSVKVGKVNVDEEPDLARQFQVMNIPLLVVMKDGKAVNQIVGVRPKKEITDMLENL